MKMRLICGTKVFGVLLFLCMCFHYIPRTLHEVLGVLVLLPLGYHLWCFRGWWRALARGRWSWLRLVSTLVNVSLLVTVVTVIISGSMISHHLFKPFLPLAIRMNITAHQHHVSLCYALWLLTGLHLGLHAEALVQRLRAGWQRRSAALAALLVAAGGIYASFVLRLGDRLQLKHIFAAAALQKGAAYYLVCLLAVFGLYVVLGWGIQRLLRGRK